MLFVASALLALANFATAQNASVADTATVQANFNNAHLVPDLLQKFNPQGTVSIAYGGETLEIGELIDQSSVASAPSLTVAAASGATAISTSNKYTVLLIDADIVGTNALTTPLTRHWLVNSASLTSSDDDFTVSYDGATTITDYAGPGPASGSGAHRYTILIYDQPSTFTAPANLSTAGTALGTMYLNSYVTESGLGDLVAANYFQVENGEATVSVVATTAVNTASLGGATTTSGSNSAATSAGGSTAASGASGAAAATSSAAAATSAAASATGAASNLKVAGSIIVGAAGVAGAILAF